MNILPKNIEDIIIDYKYQLEIIVKYDKILTEMEKSYLFVNDRYHFCDNCNISNEYLILKDCYKLHIPQQGFSHAFMCYFCKDCTNEIQNFDNYYPNNT